VKNLREYLNTEYAYDSLSLAVSEFFEGEKEVDLGGIRMTPTVADIVHNAINNGAKVIDSVNKDRNKILEENYRRLALALSEIELPSVNSVDELPDLIKNLNDKDLYVITSKYEIAYPLATIILLRRPEVNIDIEASYDGFFSYVSKYLYEDFRQVIKTTNKFNIVMGATYMEIEVAEKSLDKKFYIIGIGDVTWKELRSSHRFLPSYFGKDQIMKDQYLKTIWQPVAMGALKDIADYFSNKPQTLKEFLAGGNE
jgi:hypothetical protein